MDVVAYVYLCMQADSSLEPITLTGTTSCILAVIQGSGSANSVRRRLLLYLDIRREAQRASNVRNLHPTLACCIRKVSLPDRPHGIDPIPTRAAIPNGDAKGGWEDVAARGPTSPRTRQVPRYPAQPTCTTVIFQSKTITTSKGNQSQRVTNQIGMRLAAPR